MDGEEDVAAALPRPPLPAPARREAAIAQALRRYDGAADAAPAGGEGARAGGWWPAPGRPWAGALAGAFLVAVVGLPLVWSSFDRYVAEEGEGRPPAAEAPAAEQAAADADLPLPPFPGEPVPPAMADAVAERPAAGPQRGDSPAGPAKAGEPAPVSGDEALSGSAPAPEGDQIVVAGSRIRNPDLTSSSPVAVVGGEEITLTGTRVRRGDWNACTIDDPKRDLRACRRTVNPAAKGVPGRAAAQMAEGLTRAWEGEQEESIAAFDRAIEIAPRSAAAYLNRGLAWRRAGDLDRALADLDRAARIDPRSARVYYHRSRVLHERGDERRARSDEERAVGLDPAYEALVRAQRRQRR